MKQLVTKDSPRIAGTCVAAVLLALAVISPLRAETSQDFSDQAKQSITKGDFAAALIQLRNAERQAPQDPIIHARLAALYLRSGNNQEAEREAKAAGTLGGKDSDYLPLLMGAMLRGQKFAELLIAVPAADRSPDVESKVREARAFAQAALHDNDQAIASLRQAVQLDPASPGPQIALARVLVSTNATDEANKILDDLLAKNPRLARALEVKAQILEMGNDWDGALQKFNAAIEADPKDIGAHLGRANLYLLRQDTADADKDLDPVLAANPKYPVANYLRALELAQQGKLNDADQLLTKISSGFPNLVEGFFLQGMVQYAQGKMEQAEDNLTKYNARVPNNARAIRILAAIALKRGTPSRAIDYLQHVLEKTPPDAATLTLLGDAYEAAHKPELALKEFQAAADLKPEDPGMKAQLAVSKIDAGQGEQGLALLEGVYDSQAGAKVAGPALVLSELRAGHVGKASEVAQALVAKDSNNSLYQTLLGMVRFVQRDFKGAETALSAVIARDPNFTPASQSLAQVYLASGRRDEAKKVYEALAARQPSNATTLLALTDLAMADHDWKSAADYIGRATVIAPNDPMPQIKLIELYLLQKNYQSAKATASSLLAPFPNNPDVLDAEGRVQLATGDFSAAAITYRRAFEIASTSPVMRNRYIAALRAAKDFKTARDVLSQQLTHDPNNLPVKLELIRTEADIGGIDAGLAKAHDFASKDPTNPAYDIVSAELLEKAGRTSDATALLENRREKQPAIFLALAQLYQRQHEPEKAEAILKTELQNEPADVNARVALAGQYLQGQQYDQARKEYEQIIAQAPNMVGALNNLAWLYQQQGDISKAREVADRAVALAPQNASVVDTLGWIMMAQGDNDDALKYLKTAGASTTDPEVQYHLAVVLQRTGQSAGAKTLLQDILNSGAPFQSKPDAEKLLTELTKG